MQGLITEQTGCALTVTLNRPQQRNALNSATLDELERKLGEAEDNPQLRALVIRGAGGNFCAGGDLADMLEAQQAYSDGNQRAFTELSRRYGGLLQALKRSRLVIICAVEGVVMGGGVGLVCASDFTIAAPGSRFSLPETRLGLIPAQIAPFLNSRIGPGQTRRLALAGEILDAAEAQHIGLVHQLAVSAEELGRGVDGILDNIRRSAPGALATTKTLVRRSGEISDEELGALLDEAAEDFSAAVLSEEAKEGAMAFIEKRKPYWAQE
ncbi:carnitinyl-CoA dehydratase [Microbulbifer aestuariivivens]|uniref:Carnitinyl-CoA dehydratase n=1 Tax=Microbulbifer aestuariivivens TaxID=1908308 RepID=A0ABP9WN22_9GAMM